MSSKANIALPPKLIPVFSGSAFVRGAYGGRGSGKTRSFALMAAVRAYMFAQADIRGVILCGREYMNSLEDSSLEEIKQAISEHDWLAAQFDVGEKYIRTKCKRVSFVFAGLRHNLNSIKSKARILIAWIDEAEDASEIAWIKLIPTIRGIDEAELWITWNPETEKSATDKRFRLNPPPESKIVRLNWQDNPKFPKVLKRARAEDERTMDDATYRWVWEGDYRTQTDAQIFRGKYRIQEFEAPKKISLWDGPYFGLDFGFAKDPTAGVKCWVFERKLYIEYDAGMVGLELDDTAEFLTERIPDIGRYVIRADSARPESISYLKRHGLPFCVGVEKGKGSVEDGIEHIKSYSEVIIHPRCTKTIEEFRLYSYKTDRLTGEIQPVPVDDNNHYIDALRYALRPLMSKCAIGYKL